jgi:hypothetical protein
MQIGPGEPPPLYRVRWKAWAGATAWQDVVAPPRVEEGLLVLKTSSSRMEWVPLHTITGPIEIEGLG